MILRENDLNLSNIDKDMGNIEIYNCLWILLLKIICFEEV